MEDTVRLDICVRFFLVELGCCCRVSECAHGECPVRFGWKVGTLQDSMSELRQRREGERGRVTVVDEVEVEDG